MGKAKYKGAALIKISPLIIKPEKIDTNEKNIPGNKSNNLVHKGNFFSFSGKIRLKYKNKPAIKADPTGVKRRQKRVSAGEVALTKKIKETAHKAIPS